MVSGLERHSSKLGSEMVNGKYNIVTEIRKNPLGLTPRFVRTGIRAEV